jgi:uncharacterized membrane protein
MRPIAQHGQKQSAFSLAHQRRSSHPLALGLFLRFANIGKKIYWYDEFETSFRIAGYSGKDLGRVLSPGRDIDVRDIQKYQRIDPETTLRDVIRSLAADVPQHPPFYFVLARLWTKLFGDSPKAIRSLSAFLAFLVIPSLYWLSRELFDSNYTALMAIMLLSASPFQSFTRRRRDRTVCGCS